MPGVHEELLTLEVVFAAYDRQKLVVVQVPRGASVADAIAASALPEAFAEYDLAQCAVGIWGKTVRRDDAVADGDRVEIYRPLAADPRDARRRLAAAGRSMGQGVPGRPRRD